MLISRESGAGSWPRKLVRRQRFSSQTALGDPSFRGVETTPTGGLHLDPGWAGCEVRGARDEMRAARFEVRSGREVRCCEVRDLRGASCSAFELDVKDDRNEGEASRNRQVKVNNQIL